MPESLLDHARDLLDYGTVPADGELGWKETMRQLIEVIEGPQQADVDREIADVRRELVMRKNVYAKRVREGRMTQTIADNQIALMQSIHDRLMRIKAAGVAAAQTTETQ